MKKLWPRLGVIAFWISWPGIWFHLRNSRRSRIILEHDGKVLVVRNWLGNGKWIFPGGGVHDNESYQQGVIREVREEVAIALTPAQLISLGMFEHHDKGFRFPYELFCSQLISLPEIKTQHFEILEARWLDPKELNQKNADAEVLRSLAVWLTQQPLLQ
jgi:8-oxo-dGTP pyrophosphatase MutT (NUDIX family)